MIDFQTLGSVDFETEKNFSHAFANTFLKIYRRANSTVTEKLQKVLDSLSFKIVDQNPNFTLRSLFDKIEDICAASDKPIVLMIDESATNNQVFIDFLAQLRAQYLRRFQQPALKSVILAGVYDIRNLRQKIRPEDDISTIVHGILLRILISI